MSFVRKYWVAGLVILLVAIHAMIIGYVRSEATRLKTVASSEIPLGLFYKQSSNRQWLTQLRVHLQAPPERRLAARATIEHNRWLIHEAVEEALRRLDEDLLADPSLVVVKDQIKQAIEQVLHEQIVERIVINDRIDLDICEFHLRPSQELITPGEEANTTLTTVRPTRKTLSEQNGDHAAADADENVAHGDGEAHGSDDGHGAAEHGASNSAHAGKHSEHAPAKATSHAPKSTSHSSAKPSAHAAKKTDSHGAPKKAKAGH